MKAPLLKSVANPARIFYVPIAIAFVNAGVLLSVYLIAMIIRLSIFHNAVNPLWFLLPLIVTHTIWIRLAQREPHLQSLIQAKFSLNRHHVSSKGGFFTP